MVAELRASAMASNGEGVPRDRSPRGSRDSRRSGSSISAAGLNRRSLSARRRSTSVPATNSPSAHCPGVDFRVQAAMEQARREAAAAQAAQQAAQNAQTAPGVQIGPIELRRGCSLQNSDGYQNLLSDEALRAIWGRRLPGPKHTE